LLINPLIKPTEMHVTALTPITMGTVVPMKGAARVPSANPIGIPHTPTIIFLIILYSYYWAL
jgi:hypothetical protein